MDSRFFNFIVVLTTFVLLQLFPAVVQRTCNWKLDDDNYCYEDEVEYVSSARPNANVDEFGGPDKRPQTEDGDLGRLTDQLRVEKHLTDRARTGSDEEGNVETAYKGL